MFHNAHWTYLGKWKCIKTGIVQIRRNEQRTLICIYYWTGSVRTYYVRIVSSRITQTEHTTYYHKGSTTINSHLLRYRVHGFQWISPYLYMSIWPIQLKTRFVRRDYVFSVISSSMFWCRIRARRKYLGYEVNNGTWVTFRLLIPYDPSVSCKNNQRTLTVLFIKGLSPAAPMLEVWCCTDIR